MSLPNKLKKMLFYAHQNFLLISQIIVGRLPPESSNNIWAHSLLAQILNKKAYNFTASSIKRNFDVNSSQNIELKLLFPILTKQNKILKQRLTEFCQKAKISGYRNDLNYETFKSVDSILLKVEKFKTVKVREVLFSFLEKFTNSLFARLSDEIESYRAS
jgi:hypothetical protein